MKTTLSRLLSVVVLGSSATVVACSDASVSPSPTNPSDADGGVTADAAPVVTCKAPTGEGTKHDSASFDADEEVWTAAASPHVVTFSLNVRAGKKLVIEPCAVVRIAKGISIDVNGTLVAEGTASTPIVFERSKPEEAWARINVNGHASARFAYVTLDGGGNPGNSKIDTVAALRLGADPNESGPIVRSTRVDHLAIRSSSSLGLSLEGIAAFTEDSRDLVITKSASAPLRTWQRAVGTVPMGDYTGNAVDEILLEGGGYGRSAIEGEVKIPVRGLPYHVISSLRVGRAVGGADVVGTLTLEPGLTLRFDKGLLLSMAGTDGTGDGDRALGSLVAVGTPEKPIVLTSSAATPAAGDWGGLTFSGTATPKSRIEHTTIAYAGGGSGISSASCGNGTGGFGDEAAVTVTGWDAQPSESFIRNTRIEHSPRYGIVSGWRGTAVDFVASNTFVDVASCWVSSPRNRDNVCPANPECPGHAP